MIEEFSYHRTLDRGNPTPGNLGTDFNRLGIRFWPEVLVVDTRNAGRRQALEELAVWRNAIAHQDFDPARLGGRTALQLRQVRGWRTACQSLARSFDQVMRNHLKSLFGRRLGKLLKVHLS